MSPEQWARVFGISVSVEIGMELITIHPDTVNVFARDPVPNKWQLMRGF